jgi:DNA-binding NarL/FixJ family response regulator
MNRSNTFKKRLFALTERRKQIVNLVDQGLSNRVIAEKLNLSEGTVRNHLHRIFRKLNIRRRIALVSDRPKSVKRLEALTDRQQQVATLACRGLSNREIADKLVVSKGTVKMHLHGAYERLDVRSRNGLANALAH